MGLKFEDTMNKHLCYIVILTIVSVSASNAPSRLKRPKLAGKVSLLQKQLSNHKSKLDIQETKILTLSKTVKDLVKKTRQNTNAIRKNLNANRAVNSRQSKRIAALQKKEANRNDKTP